LYITGNKNLYSSGNTNNTFDVKRKFKFTNNRLNEVEQPFYMVGIKGYTLNPIKLYESQKLEEEILQLPKNYPIEILLSQNSHNSMEGLYLVKTKFGLLGWTILKAGQYKSIDVDSLIYYGD